MALYKMKPRLVSAKQWFALGDHPAVIRGWYTPEGVTTEADLAAAFGIMNTTEFTGLWLDSGVFQPVNTGDWIIVGTLNEIYSCSAELFAEVYEPAT